MPIPAAGSANENILASYLDDLEQNEVWQDFIASHPDSTTQTPAALLAFVQDKYLSAATNTLSPEEDKQRKLAFTLFDLIILITQLSQDSVSTLGATLDFYAQWQKNYADQIAQMPVYKTLDNTTDAAYWGNFYTKKGGTSQYGYASSLNKTDLGQSTFGYDNISLDDISTYMANAPNNSSFGIPLFLDSRWGGTRYMAGNNIVGAFVLSFKKDASGNATVCILPTNIKSVNDNTSLFIPDQGFFTQTISAGQQSDPNAWVSATQNLFTGSGSSQETHSYSQPGYYRGGTALNYTITLSNPSIDFATSRFSMTVSMVGVGSNTTTGPDPIKGQFSIPQMDPQYGTNWNGEEGDIEAAKQTQLRLSKNATMQQWATGKQGIAQTLSSRQSETQSNIQNIMGSRKSTLGVLSSTIEALRAILTAIFK